MKKEGKILKMRLKEYKSFYISIFLCLFLTLIGFLMNFSSSFYQIAFLNKFELSVLEDFLIRILFALIGFFLFLSIPKKFWCKYNFLNLFISFLLLTGVLIFGYKVGGAKRWIDLKIISIQPFEIFKPFYLAFLSAYFYKHKKEKIYFIIFISFLFFILVALEPNFASAFSILFVTFMLLFIRGIKFLKIAKLSIITSSLIILIIILGKNKFSSHVIKRTLKEFKENREYEQVIQAKIAITSGGIFGKGIGKGEAKYLYLPEIKKDFIFSLICEEIGILGGTLLILIYSFIIISLLKISFKTCDPFLSTLTAGFGMFLFYNTFIHIGVNIGVLPVTGVPLPFISFGGSSLLSNFMSIGIILRAINEKEEIYEEKIYEKEIIL
jgi:cell division protein FtsW